jgi:hypothetical protein
MKLDSFRTNARAPRVQAWRLVAFPIGLFAIQGCQPAKSDHSTDKSNTQQEAPPSPKPASSAAAKAPEPATKRVNDVEALPFKLEELATSCGRICESTKVLACTQHAECQNGCIQAFGTPVCVAELRRFLSCTENSPATSFECSPEGIPALKDGVCDSEQGAVMGCFTKATH